MTVDYFTSVGIGVTVRPELRKLLNQQVADMFGLFSQTKQALECQGYALLSMASAPTGISGGLLKNVARTAGCEARGAQAKGDESER